MKYLNWFLMGAFTAVLMHVSVFLVEVLCDIYVRFEGIMIGF